MNDWLTGVGCDPAVLVTVAMVEGSGPRAAGTKMVVTQRQQFGTIGGGHLEMRALELARRMLLSVSPVSLQRFPLGASLGQCCGGVVHLVFEPIGAALEAVLSGLDRCPRQDRWRLSCIDGATSVLLDACGTIIAGAGTGLPSFACANATHVLQDDGGRRWLVDACRAPQAHLTLFGAGHVGAALVRALADLPCHITWVDERADLFPATLPANAMQEASDTPEALVEQAPAGASFLVMTHSHALDLRLTEAIMARADVGWFGLIGSQTKRRQFEHRLRARGCAPDRIAAMVCPIGLPGITNKAPCVIAASVCAQLLMVWEADARIGGAPPRPVGAGLPAIKV